MEIIKPYCTEQKCTQKCFGALVIRKYCIQQIDRNQHCNKNFQLIRAKSLERSKNVISIVDKHKMLVTIQLSYKGDKKYSIAILDTGAELSLICWEELKKMYPRFKVKMLGTETIEMIGVTNTPIQYMGTVELLVLLGTQEKWVKFYVTEEKCQLLLGLPALQAFKLVIDLERNICYFNDTQTNIQTVIKRVKTVEKMAYRLSPVKFYCINTLNPRYIELNICGKGKGTQLINKELVIFECTCLLESTELCNGCKKQSVVKGYVVPKPSRGVVRIIYCPQDLMDLSPKTSFFQGILTNNWKKIANSSNGLLAEVENIEPACWTYENGMVSFQMNGFHKENICNPKLETKVETPDFFENSCGSCENKGLPFCDFKNENCGSLEQLKNRVHIGANLVKCSIKLETIVPNMHQINVVLCHYKDSEQLQQLYEIWPFYKDAVSNEEMHQNKVLCFKSQEYYHFIISGLYPTFYESEEQLRKISNACEKFKITSLWFIGFNELKVSNQTVTRIFHNQQINIRIVTNYPKVGKQVQKVQFQGKIQAEVHEDSPETKLNILIDDEKYVNKFKKLAKELNKEEGLLKSVWAKSNQDIGLLTSGFPNYNVLKFKLPIKDECNTIPTPNKTHFVKPQMVGAATEFLEKLLQLNIIERGYTPYNARTFFIPKAKQELSKKTFLERGGCEKDYHAGMIDDLAPQGIRMVCHFNQLNDICYVNPVVQPSTTEQIEAISSKVRYLTAIDITGCYHSLALSKTAQPLTGCDSGLPMGRFYFLRVPMGASASKNLQDCALLHVLAQIDNLLVYSDNILVVSEEKEEHYETVEKVLYRLRDHGLKVKPSKTSLMAHEKVRLYGFIINLKTGRLQPTEDKIAALRNRAVPNSRKELKQFLGAIQFFSQLLPLVKDDLAILHKATRGMQYKFEEKEIKAFENIKFLLKDSALLFIHRADPSRKFYMNVDTSMYHTAWVLYQTDDELHPRVLKYGYKSWEEKFSRLIPALRELYGLLVALENVVDQVAYSQKGLLIYTDSLPVILCSLYSKANAKIARVKIFLESLSFLEISFSPGLSKQILLPDFFTRKCDDPPRQTQKKPMTEDVEKCKTIDRLLDKTKAYKASQHLFMIDSILEQDDDVLEKIKPKSVTISGSNVQYEIVKEGNLVKTENIIAMNTKKGGVLRCAHIRCIKATEVQKQMQQTKIGTLRVNVQNKVNDYIENITEKNENRVHKDFLITKNKVRVQCDLQEPNMEDINLAPKNTSFENDNGQIANETADTETDFSRYFAKIVATAKYLDFEKLKQAIKQDPHWKKIYNDCLIRANIVHHGKVFFLHKETLFCKQTIQGMELYKLVIPQLLAYELVQQTHRMTACCKGKKLQNQINLSFEINNLEFICTQVTRECFNCSLTAKPFIAIREDMPKFPQRLIGKAKVWALDELQIVSEATGARGQGFHKLICATDLFSHFMVAEPLYGILTEEKMLNFLQRNIIQIFGMPLIVTTDNATAMDSTLIRGVCSYLGIIKTTIAPYSSKSNLQELLNRLILDSLRNMTASLYMKPEYFHILISPVIRLVNSVVFTNHRFLSPHFIMFGTKPNIDFIQLFESNPNWPENKTEYIKWVVEANNIAHKLRLGQIENRMYKTGTAKAEKYRDKITRGSIVSIKNPELIIKKENYKLRPKFKNRYIVVDKTNSSVLIRPCDEIAIEHFFDKDYNPKHDVSLFLYKADITNIKLLTNTLILNTNKPDKFYTNFLKQNFLPPTFYYQKNNDGGVRITQLDSQEVVNERLLLELENAKKVQKITKKSILKSKRKQEILEIATLFKNLAQAKVKRVKFEEFTTVLPFRCPNRIYFGQSSYPEPVNAQPKLVFRRLQDNSYCCCKACVNDGKTKVIKCMQEKCPQCVVTQKKNRVSQLPIHSQDE